VSSRPDREEVQKARHTQQDRPQGAARRITQQAKEEISSDPTATARQAAQERLRAQQHAIRNATACHLAGMDLARYYRGGLLDVPLDRLLAVGRWAA
jgi:hypothetical protein